ncbi:ferritin-like domain-containing protein [Mucilaginibacter arboris]|uniref:Ferritin-like domain-containing protein n=1 Tax=Mucilaginibacter arboris TaxID=2682090 RepID=A0A7K1SYK7_9SPHI|nr:ferritin-like domain-containing protein [Mucilaginibacter arboris]MVN22348.1 ferritin-like domain-containing protein [Mucilaginibacter arboris]
MDLLNIIEEIEKVDPEFQEKISPRRAAIKNITSFGSKVAVAALPFALGSLFKKAYAQQSTSAIVGVLNYALQLEFLEANFYNAGLTSTTFATMKAGLSASELAGLTLIQTDENNHVKYLQGVITQLGGTPVNFTAANFDFTAKGTFPMVYTSSDIWLAVAETFEDTGVRAYKGQATALLRNKTVLTAALNIHSVEARHASHLRMLRRARGVSIKPWITGANDTGIGTSVNASYAGEDNVVQGPVTITNLPGVSGNTSVNAATEAFDEPLTMPQVVQIVTPFFK